MFMICLSYSLSGQDVDISIDHPSQVKAGEEFTISVIINKGSLSDYSRFSQDLPLGLTAVNISSPNADFSFDNQRIRIIWLKLPDTEEVTVSYKVMVNERLKGSFVLGGVFAYVVEEERKFLNFKKTNDISITPSTTIDPAYIVDIKNFKGENEPLPAPNKLGAFAMAIRQKPVLLSSGEYLVKIIVNRPEGSKYLKIEESIPSGYVFEEVNSYNSIASLAPSVVKFIWMSLPEDPVFEIEYKLVPLANQPQGDMLLDGQLTYTEGDQNRLVAVEEIDVNVDELDQDERLSLLQTGQIPEKAVKTDQQVVKQPPPDPAPVVKQPVASSNAYIENTRVLIAENGLYYRVQIVATGTAFNAAAQFRNEGVDQEVMVEQHQGLYKYTAGSFRTYEDANSYKNRMERIQSVDGAFVVAYRNGKRIPVPSVQ